MKTRRWPTRKRISVSFVFILFICFLVASSGCTAKVPPPSQLPSSLTQTLSTQITSEIAGVNIAETTALTILFRISEELDEARSDGLLSEEEEAELRADLMEKFTGWVSTRKARLPKSS